ncbi:STE3-domain-containing protein [Peniophora sp. CONT]|nr:STE3-domain-containing protein [Peniophora sp. CONT]
MAAVDPTYPLYPLASILAAAMLLLVLLTSFVRQSWNLGVAFLCFWLFWENLTGGVAAIIWSDNADIKLYVYCDIISRIQLVTFIVKPMCTLIITRRLYLIARLRSEDAFSVRKHRADMIIEWTLGLAIPLLLAGPLYYVNQFERFQVTEGTGCGAAITGQSVLGILFSTIWSFVPPLLSTIIYYPRIMWILYTRHKDTNRFLHSSQSISHTSYYRLLALASIDALVTLPFGITTFILSLLSQLKQTGVRIPFYDGWDAIHSDWTPSGITYAEVSAIGRTALAETYFARWTSPFLAFVIFALFGVTGAARETYWKLICTVGGWLGWKRSARQDGPLDTMVFGSRPRDNTRDAESSFHDPSTGDDDSQNMQSNKISGVVQIADSHIYREASSENKEETMAYAQPMLEIDPKSYHSAT